MRFGLIGYGLWGRHHAAAIVKAPGAELAGISCLRPASAAAARKDFPAVPVHLDYHALLDSPDIDAVAIVVPNDLHGEIGVAALLRGKDVLLEKPMAPTLAECDRLLDASRRSGRVLSIGHELRLSAQWGRVKALIDAGDIGLPLSAVVNLFRFPYRQGSSGWRYQPDRVGSWILEELVHHFDFLMWYFERKVKRRGQSEVETLTLAPSGERFELEEELRQTVTAFRERRPLVSGEEARKRVAVCLEAERSLRERREVPLNFGRA